MPRFGRFLPCRRSFIRKRSITRSRHSRASPARHCIALVREAAEKIDGADQEVGYNVAGFGQTSVKIISFQIELTPDVFLHLENYNSMLEFNYYEMAKIVSSRFNQITQSYYVDSSNGDSIVEQKNFTVSTLFIKSIKEYNKYLYDRLVQSKLWVDFKTEREIDEFWIADNITKQINVSHFSKEEGAKFMLKMMAMAMVDKKRKEKK